MPLPAAEAPLRPGGLPQGAQLSWAGPAARADMEAALSATFGLRTALRRHGLTSATVAALRPLRAGFTGHSRRFARSLAAAGWMAADCGEQFGPPEGAAAAVPRRGRSDPEADVLPVAQLLLLQLDYNGLFGVLEPPPA